MLIESNKTYRRIEVGDGQIMFSTHSHFGFLTENTFIEMENNRETNVKNK